MTPGEVYCLEQSARCLELAEMFKSYRRIDAMSFWIKVYHAFLDDARKFKEGGNHVEPQRPRNHADGGLGHRLSGDGLPAFLQRNGMRNG